MKKNLDSFKEKANAILLKDAMLKVGGGTEDPWYCHNFQGKLDDGYSQDQIDYFFSDHDRADRFNSMYEDGNIDLANRRQAFFISVVG